MRKLLICVLTLLSLTTFSQDYRIESNFKADKKYYFTVKRAKVDSREPMTKDLAQLTQVEATFTQIDSRFKCVWKYGEAKAVGPENLISQIGPEYNELFNQYKDFEIEILFDPYNGGIVLLNYEKMKENIVNGFLKVSNNQMIKIDSATMILIYQQLEPTYSTSEILLSTYFPEIILYFNLYSRNFTAGIRIKSDYSYPNPFGEEAFPVVGEIGIDSDKDNILIISNKEQAKQEEVNRILKDMVERMSTLGNSPITKEEMPDFKLNTESYYYYDIQNKMIYMVKLEKKVEVTGITQTQILEINYIQ